MKRALGSIIRNNNSTIKAAVKRKTIRTMTKLTSLLLLSGIAVAASLEGVPQRARKQQPQSQELYCR
eukprot:scaffold78530_cov62-Attheya_sp.AAC.1